MRHVARQSKILPRRPAFTLVELLVVMGVLAMMSSLVLVGLASAAEQARVSRTRSQVQKIHELLMTRWEDYRYRRVEATREEGYVDPARSASYPLRDNVRARQTLRLDRIRELMRMEMPCHKEEVLLDSSFTSIMMLPYEAGGTPARPSATTSSLQNRYRRIVNTRAGGAAGWSEEFDDAECLYMILESIQDGDTNGLDFFKESEIGDVDGDNMPEILDAWGNPIRFCRWAPGFVGVRSNLHRRDQPDPFDPLNVRGGRATNSSNEFIRFPLYPLVISAGPDGEVDIVLRFPSGSASPSTTMDPIVLSTNAASDPPNDPYYTDSSTSMQLGTEADWHLEKQGTGFINVPNGVNGYLDNISNHQLVIPGND